MKLINLFAISIALCLLILPSCLGNDGYNDYSEWKALNDDFLKQAETETQEGSLVYNKVVPNWDRNIFVLMQWHNKRTENENKLFPLSNSTVTLNYTLTNVQGDTLDMGNAFQCQPNTMITGFWTAVTNMIVGDTVTAILPYNAAYGVGGSGAILPYSTLIFGIRLESIDKLY